MVVSLFVIPVFSTQVNQEEMVTQDREESLDQVDLKDSLDHRVHLARGENLGQLDNVENLEKPV